MISSLRLSMTFSENRFPLFRIMLQLPRGLAQIGIDACLPSIAGLAVGRQYVVVKSKLHRLFRMFEWWPATLDDLGAVTDLRPVQHLLCQFRSFVILRLCNAVSVNLGQIALDRFLSRGHCTFSSRSRVARHRAASKRSSPFGLREIRQFGISPRHIPAVCLAPLASGR
jgi:hypothetical protein